MAKVRATSNIRFNGKRFVAGDIVDGLTEKQAAQLIEVGSAERASTSDKASAGKKVERKASEVKARLLKDADKKGTRKSVAEKGQARNAKKDEDKAPEQPEEPVNTDEGSNGQDDSQKPAEQPQDSQDGNDEGSGEPEDTDQPNDFKVGDDEYTIKSDKNNNAKYYLNGKEIKKLAWLTAYQEAQE